MATGGAGFIGSNFVHWVVDNQADVHVTALDKLTYAGNKANLAEIPEDRITFVEGDICDAELVDGLNVRDWIHAQDQSSAVWTILTKGCLGETYLIGADGEKSNIDVLRAILVEVGCNPDDFEWVKDRRRKSLWRRSRLLHGDV